MTQAAAETTASTPTARQPISGVAPPQLGEVTVMTVWPTMGSLAPGRLLGLMYRRNVRSAWGNILTFKNLIVLVTIPFALLMFAWLIAPFRCLRYRLTNRRVIIQRGYTSRDVTSVTLDQFDTIDVHVIPGQEWFHAGDLVFKRGPIETFRLHGVSRPETFRQTCIKARMGYVGVAKAMGK